MIQLSKLNKLRRYSTIRIFFFCPYYDYYLKSISFAICILYWNTMGLSSCIRIMLSALSIKFLFHSKRLLLVNISRNYIIIFIYKCETFTCFASIYYYVVFYLYIDYASEELFQVIKTNCLVSVILITH